MNNYLSVVIDCICTTFGYVIVGVFRYFQSVVECPDLLLMFSSLQIKNAVCWTMFQYLLASWLLITEHHLMSWLPQYLLAMLQCLPASWILMVGFYSMTQ